MKKNKKTKFLFLALSPTGKGISGGDRIFIELAREWSKYISVEIYTTKEGIEMCKRQKLYGKHLSIKEVEKSLLPSSIFLKYLYKVYLGIKLALFLDVLKVNVQETSNKTLFLYSSSDFWMDVFPAVILKIRYPKLRWIATWFQTAPNPLKGFSDGNRKQKYRFSAFLYWLSQFPVKPLIKKYADFIIVNNDDERKQFLEIDRKRKVIVLVGAVRLAEIEKYQSLFARDKQLSMRYDAVFQGRFHPQKGVVELIEIWRKVVDKVPNAKLAMIGDGPLMKDVKFKIQELGLRRNVVLFGFVFDGIEKYKIFSQSKIVVHPAFYDSGGMASAEAMAFGLPCVGFNLKSYDSYYPQGMIKVEKGNLEKFSEAIVTLLIDDSIRTRTGEIALEMIRSNWSWKGRATNLLSKII